MLASLGELFWTMHRWAYQSTACLHGSQMLGSATKRRPPWCCAFHLTNARQAPTGQFTLVSTPLKAYTNFTNDCGGGSCDLAQVRGTNSGMIHTRLDKDKPSKLARNALVPPPHPLHIALGLVSFPICAGLAAMSCILMALSASWEMTHLGSAAVKL